MDHLVNMNAVAKADLKTWKTYVGEIERNPEINTHNGSTIGFSRSFFSVGVDSTSWMGSGAWFDSGAITAWDSTVGFSIIGSSTGLASSPLAGTGLFFTESTGDEEISVPADAGVKIASAVVDGPFTTLTLCSTEVRSGDAALALTTSASEFFADAAAAIFGLNNAGDVFEKLVDNWSDELDALGEAGDLAGSGALVLFWAAPPGELGALPGGVWELDAQYLINSEMADPFFLPAVRSPMRPELIRRSIDSERKLLEWGYWSMCILWGYLDGGAGHKIERPRDLGAKILCDSTVGSTGKNPSKPGQTTPKRGRFELSVGARSGPVHQSFDTRRSPRLISF
jgi:hypothetical protein